MAASTHVTLVSADDLPALSSRLAAEGKRTELVKGDLVVMAPAGGRHGHIANTIAYWLTEFNHVAGQAGMVFAAETGFLLRRDPDTVRAPDVSFVAYGRLAEDEPPSGYMELAPDLAVEVVSPNDSPAAIRDKVQDWLEAGTPLVWVVYPDSRSIAVHSPAGRLQELEDTDILSGAPALPDFTVAVRACSCSWTRPLSPAHATRVVI